MFLVVSARVLPLGIGRWWSLKKEPNNRLTKLCPRTARPRKWLAIPGLHGDPVRIYHMTMEQALFYHRKVFATMKVNTFGAWWKFGGWYKDYRETISTCPR
jgi:hypothetical protein